MDLPGTSRPIRRRPHTVAPRRRQVVVRLSEDEFDVVRVAADGAGLALGAWLGQLAVRSADPAGWSLGVSRRDVVRQLMRLRIDVSFLERVLVEVGEARGSGLVAAVLARLDALIDLAVDESSR